MDIVFLGTGAADFLPTLADSDRFTVDKYIRRSTVTLLNGTTLIDCGPHLLDELKIHHIDEKKIRNVLITHKHSDHFNPANLNQLATLTDSALHVWYPKEIDMPALNNVVLHPMTRHETYQVDTLSVTPLKANHTADAVHYSIEENDKKFFYGCDGAWLMMDTYNYMIGKRYSMMVLDATVGDYEGDYRMAEHNSIPMIRMMLSSFKTVEIATDETVIVLDHLARTLHKSYEETCRLVEKDGFVVAYDGLSMEV